MTTATNLTNKLAALHGTLEDLGRQDDDWTMARHLEDRLGSGQYTDVDMECATVLLEKYRVLSKVNPEQEWETFGSPTANSRWFNHVPKVEVNADGRVVWKCPTKDCFGEMLQTGEVWLTNPPGYHHQCNLCGFTAAIKGAVFGELRSEH